MNSLATKIQELDSPPAPIRVRALSSPSLKGLGITSADLTPTNLFDEGILNGPCPLQKLTERGYLAEIIETAPNCLTPYEVLTPKNYPLTDERPNYTSFLLFCARWGYYATLPKQYHTRAFILRRNPRLAEMLTPLSKAANSAKLDLFPLTHLEVGDIDSYTLQCACMHGQTDLIEHLIRPDQIDFRTIQFKIMAVYQGKKLPNVILKNLTAEKMLVKIEAYSYALPAKARALLPRAPFMSTLYDAVYLNLIHLVPPDIFAERHYPEAKNEIKCAITSIRLDKNFPQNETDACIYAAYSWLQKLSKEVLGAAANSHAAERKKKLATTN